MFIGSPLGSTLSRQRTSYRHLNGSFSRSRQRPDWQLSSESEVDEDDVAAAEASKDEKARKASRHAKEMPPKNKK